ncbi:PH domain-containing protein [Amycolatopsis sp., V23-08]|uniref:PH domain-containing protein n=1 Tax=Amycolatopsis heterodermiae TaxID=3110235 RepID=A0ABU5QX24_9PSEU|nr:PH domain-containing protein [Amycolatopsis sp., V23-08]MEA5358190.1 PH domain-containing protein [Amycolatopsis sp., V23-08]
MQAYTGEQVLWTGKPVHRTILSRYDHIAVPLAAVVLAVVGYFAVDETAAERPHALLAMVACGGLLLFLAGSRAVQLRRLTYVLTDRRLVVDTGVVWRRTRTQPLAELDVPVVLPERGGAGTITFGPVDPRLVAAARYGAHRIKAVPLPIVLTGIAEPERVRALFAEAIGEARRKQAAGEPDDSLF